MRYVSSHVSRWQYDVYFHLLFPYLIPFHFASLFQPLISPEGYKLGTFCIIDDKTRLAGLSQDDQNSLRDFAAMSVKELVERRTNLKKHQNPAQLIAYTAHDLMTPLTGVQLSLSLLKEDDEVKEKLGGHQQELLSTAANCSDLMIRICQTAIDTLREESSSVPDVPVASVAGKGSTPATKMSDLIRSLTMIMEPIPKRVPLVITLDSSVPPTIMSDDLKLFRSTLNLISNGVGRTEVGIVHLKIFVEAGEKSKIMFECIDTGPEVQVEDYQYLFHPSRTAEGDFRLGLSSVATLINSLDGEYGFRPRGLTENGNFLPSKKSGALFWFSVPLYTPETFGVNSGEEIPVSVIRKIASSTSVKRDELKRPIIPQIPRTGSRNSQIGIMEGLMNRSSSRLSLSKRAMSSTNLSRASSSSCGLNGLHGSGSSLSSVGRRRIPVVVGDPLQANSILNSCFGNSFDAVTPSIKGANANPSSTNQSPIGNSGLPQRKRRALIIEDSLVVRKSLARALERLGMVVTQAVNGLEGLERMKSKLFDLVLCDFLMPVMDGIDCVRQYREWEKQNRPDFKHYIVGISAHANANEGDKGIKAGMNEFRPKPVSIKILTDIKDMKELTDIGERLDEMDAANSGFDSGSSSTSLSVMERRHSHSSLLGLRKVNSNSHFGSTSHFGKRTATASGLSGQQNQVFELSKPSSKRKKIDIGVSGVDNRGSPVCLIATDTPSQYSVPIARSLEREGWTVVVAHDGNEALRLLQTRNWNAVLVYDNLPLIPGSLCVDRFRTWEQQNRVNRQRNMFMICSSPIPSLFDKTSVIQPPTGFDGVLGRPVEWKELNHMLGMKKDRSMELIFGSQPM